MSTAGKVQLELSEDEALVLWDWLTRFHASQPRFEDQAEQRALWDLEASLEKKLPVVLSPDFAERLRTARDRVRDVLG